MMLFFMALAKVKRNLAKANHSRDYPTVS